LHSELSFSLVGSWVTIAAFLMLVQKMINSMRALGKNYHQT
jgi:hypothetical protein